MLIILMCLSPLCNTWCLSSVLQSFVIFKYLRNNVTKFYPIFRYHSAVVNPAFQVLKELSVGQACFCVLLAASEVVLYRPVYSQPTTTTFCTVCVVFNSPPQHQPLLTLLSLSVVTIQ